MGFVAPLKPETVEDFRNLRRYLHTRPELAYAEHETSTLVANYLRDWGFDVETGIGGTGVVGSLTVGPGEKTVGIRADMDALPIEEVTGLAYASQTPGKMHACGHDGHTTILLATAQKLAATRNFSGTVRLIFQPAEEIGGGARTMINDGLFERFPVDTIFGLHNWPGIPAGQFAFLEGPAMASVDMAVIRIQGKGGHGAKPHLSIDPVVVAASLILALQTVVSRNIDPLQAAVVTVGSIHGGSLPNVIPDSVELQLTVRSFDETVRQSVRERITALVHTHAASYGATADLRYPTGYPVLVNDAAQTHFAHNVAKRHFGADRVDPTLRPITASEDFAFMLEKRPGSYLFLGNGDSADLHSPRYDFNDAIIPDAARYWVHLVEDFLSGNTLAEATL
ncbi:M20 aminoacylase family protein [Devosia sp.]|uniref:M20 aminoacylase family protein n=1 Tax=Devosia sp. TaxID=1871048 RepID=UPI001AC08CF0|nr:M20 aminoacylase family protein [Devosia sp.]MBN9334627.1 amidohydrolase [Devosia sp.]